MPNRVLASLVLCMAAVNSGCATPRLVIEAQNARTNTHVVLAFEETVFNKHHVREGFSRYVGPEYREHDPLLPDDIDAATKALNNQLSALPNSRLLVKRTVAQGDLVAVQAFWDQRPGETRGTARLDIYRLVNAKIVEHWIVVEAVPEGSGAERMF